MTTKTDVLGGSDHDLQDPSEVLEVGQDGAVTTISDGVDASVATLLDPSQNFTHLSEDFFLRLDQRKDAILRDASVLLETTLLDEMDRTMIGQVMAFIEHPTDTLSDIEAETVRIANVGAGYMMQGEDAPPVIDAMHEHLFALQCVNRIRFVEKAIKDGDFYSPTVTEAWNRAFEWAIYAKDNAITQAVHDLQLTLKEARLGERLGDL